MHQIDKYLDDLIDQLPDEFVPAMQAQFFVGWCRENCADDLDDWLHQRVTAIFTQRFVTVLKQRRLKARRDAGARGFRNASVALASEPDGLNIFEGYSATLHEGLWKRLRDFTHEDCIRAAGQHRTTAKANANWSKFYDALSRRVPAGGVQTVGQVLTLDETEALMEQYTAK